MKLHNPLPESLDVQCTKAASILEHFAKGTTKLDSTFIPFKILEKARGIAIITIVKAGFLWSGRAGSGLVVARLPDGSWSAPSAIMVAGAGVGAQIGAEITDFVFVLNNAAAVRSFSHSGNLTLGGNMSVAAGPTGRTTEAAGMIADLAPIYSYSKSKGLFAGVSLEGTVIITRNDANKAMYGKKVSALDLLSGKIPPPVEAGPLYRMLSLSRFANMGQSNSKIECLNSPQGGDDAHADLGSSQSTSNDVVRKTSARMLAAGSTLKRSHDSSHQTLPEYASEGSISRVGPAPISSTSSSASKLNDSPFKSAKPSQKSPPLVKAKPEMKKSIALFDFTGQRQGDLQFRQGDIIWIIKSTPSQNDWWTGRCGNSVGEFPANYVKVE
ncbi:hypothetical protein BATDEDRAFT_9413 [Batrachochytrium dendrobatidis JAM81]|uniref:SH3 domain-containing protein n=1 Tax=Batrachochytrium dendrobatidis (strain JAM81 / FGSC 10211) TaxID=684364 RepID=F4NX66_BATDJ|nr:uncharacterized protein BATDEDRAFT_9413 [Batrachochytrium dendrobatidis JAM81]EGF82619.1 hypothetical protein BATDEDRAFT_9413 [Batrachochytrium dendrobatidis JAM81]|eukprot:XP_006676510.1 hypothetical protein BATDEDRAFT_9413 [Batrachochytrium dendrobatidis JAM81]